MGGGLLYSSREVSPIGATEGRHISLADWFQLCLSRYLGTLSRHEQHERDHKLNQNQMLVLAANLCTHQSFQMYSFPGLYFKYFFREVLYTGTNERDNHCEQ